MPTRSDDQQPSHRSGTIAQDHARDATPLSVALPASIPNEPEVVYELRDDDFILVDPDETIEFQTGMHMPRPAPPPPLPEQAPLPAWAAASRAVLNGWSGEQSQVASELREARDDLIRFARQTYAREVYVQEVERALAAAQGRVRGQAFRIAELEQAARATEIEALRTQRELERRNSELTALLATRERDARASEAAVPAALERSASRAMMGNAASARVGAGGSHASDARIAEARSTRAARALQAHTGADAPHRSGADARIAEARSTGAARALEAHAGADAPHRSGTDARVGEAGSTGTADVWVADVEALRAARASGVSDDVGPRGRGASDDGAMLARSSDVRARDSELQALDVSRDRDVKAHAARELELRAADAESLRVMLELDLRAALQPQPAWDAPGSQPSAANAGARALLSLREYVARMQAPFAPAQYIVEAQPAPRPPAKRRAARKPASKRDDLQRIKGIGPSLAERLAKAGVKTFESVAGWKAKDLERMAETLGVSRARIEREGWVKQARALARKR
jgi:predicted flap endonuclease-1-like 5' DNA nuclease